jgi:peptide/nickel transport system ATP-binding protein
MESSDDVILDVKNMTARFQFESGPVTVVDKLSFQLKKGKTLAIVGESGCGKSMTALSLLRILPTPPALPLEGEILYQGRDLLKLSEAEMRKIRGARIAMIFQDPMSALNPVYTIGDQLLEVVNLHLDLHGDEAYEKVVQALNDVKIPLPEERLQDYPHQLSGGMKQRVMIAMALTCEPDVLIADEPTTALDVTVQAQVLDLMRDLQEKKGMALLLITHDMGVVAEMADDVIVMYATQEVESGGVYSIFDNMSHPYTSGLFQSLPGIQHGRGSLKAIQGTVPSIAAKPKGCHFHPRCPYVMGGCKLKETPFYEIDKNAKHRSRCWLHDASVKKEREVFLGERSNVCE